MKQNILIFFLLAAWFLPARAQEPVLVSPEWLHQHLKDPGRVVLYTGFVIRADFEREHIEGSRFLWPDWLAPDSPDGNMNAPDLKMATQVLQDLGINKDSKIVICHKGYRCDHCSPHVHDPGAPGPGGEGIFPERGDRSLEKSRLPRNR